MRQAHTSPRIAERGRDRDVSSNQFPEIGWTLVMEQQRNADQRALLYLLIVNLVAATTITLVLLILAQLTLGRDHMCLEAITRTDKVSEGGLWSSGQQ